MVRERERYEHKKGRKRGRREIVIEEERGRRVIERDRDAERWGQREEDSRGHRKRKKRSSDRRKET